MIKRLYQINSKIDEIKDVNQNVISNSLLSLNIFNTVIFLPIKYWNYYYHILINKNNLQNISHYMKFINNENSFVDIILLNWDSILFDLEFNLKNLYNQKDDDFKLYLHPRKRNVILQEDFFKDLKIQKIKMEEKNFSFLINSTNKTKQFDLLFKNNVKFQIINDNFDFNKSYLDKKEYFEFVKNKNLNERLEFWKKENFKDFLNENLNKKRKQDLIKEYWFEKISKRVLYEINIIENKWFQEYFYNYFKIITFLKNNWYPYFVRGSAAWSIILYLLWISNLNPIKYWIDFDRFLGWTKSADIDIDIPSDYRDKILEELNLLFLQNNKEILNILIKTSLHSENFVNHPAWILIENKSNIEAKIPLVKTDNSKFKSSLLFDSWSTPVLDAMSFLKYDLLSSQIISRMKINFDKENLNVANIIENWEEKIQWNEKFYSFLLNWTYFQFTSKWALSLLKKYEPKSYFDLVKLIAVNRPAILSNKNFNIDYIIKNLKEWYKKISKNEKINEIFLKSDSWKILLFQDQIIEILKLILPEIDDNLIIKLAKWRWELKQFKSLFVENFKKLDDNLNLINDIWNQIENFSNYWLNKAHAFSYWVITYLELYSNFILKK